MKVNLYKRVQMSIASGGHKVLVLVIFSAANRSIGSTTGCTITEKAPTRAFSWLRVPASAFTLKAKLRNYAKGCKLCLFAHLDSRYLSVKAFRETFVVTPSIIYII